jgi:hypothetical protein
MTIPISVPNEAAFAEVQWRFELIRARHSDAKLQLFPASGPVIEARIVWSVSAH